MADVSLTRLLPADDRSDRAWTAVAAGESSAAVFRRQDGTAFAKCVGPHDVDELRAERDRIDWLASTGFSGPTVKDWRSSRHGACLVLTAVPGVPASELSSPDLLRAWPSIVRLLSRLHGLPVTACPFERRVSSMFHRAEEVVRRGAVNPEFLTEEQRGVPPAALLADLRSQLDDRVAQEADDLVVCHGDACLPNFLVAPETLRCTGVIDLGRLGVADRHADLALLRANARENWTVQDEPRADRAFVDGYGAEHIDQERLRFYLHLDPLTWS